MNYWITTHYPKPESIPWFIFLKKPKKTLPKKGERVFFYETFKPKSGKGKPGKGAIVCKASVVSGELEANRFGDSKEFRYMIQCRGHEDCSIPLKAAKLIVSGPFYRSGLRRIDETQACKLEAACPG